MADELKPKRGFWRACVDGLAEYGKMNCPELHAKAHDEMRVANEASQKSAVERITKKTDSKLER